MASRTLTQIRQGVGRLISINNFYGTADATGGTTTNLRDADAKRFATGRFAGSFLLITSGTDIGKVVYCTTFSNTNGDFTVTPASSGATVYDSVTYEVWPIDPTALVDFVNKGARQLFPLLSRQVVDPSFNTSSPLWNGGFEEWTSASVATGWTASVSTLTRTASSTPGSQYMARLTAAAGYLGLSTAQRYDLSSLLNSSVTFYALVSTATASACRLRIVDADGNTTGTYHTGGGNYEVLSATRTLDDKSVDAFDFRILKDDGASTIDVERAWIEGTALRNFRVPLSMPRGAIAVYTASIRDRAAFRHTGWTTASFRTTLAEDSATSTGAVRVELIGQVAPARAMMLVGRDFLNEVVNTGDELEIDKVAGELLEHEVALNVVSSAMGSLLVSNHTELEKLYARLLHQYNRLEVRLREAQMGSTLPRDV